MEIDKKFEYIHQKKMTPADELRQILTDLEKRRLTVKKMDSTQALILLQDFDKVYQFFEQFADSDLNLSSEKGQFRELQGQYRKIIGTVLKALGGSEVLEKYRPTPPPIPKRWWWYANEIVLARQQQFRRQIFRVVAVMLLIIGGIFLAFKTVLAPDPLVIARYEAEQHTLDATEKGNYQEALLIVEGGLKQVPDSADLILLKGGLYDLLGREAEAKPFFEQAKNRLTPFPFYITRAQFYIRANKVVKAEADTREAIRIDENKAIAWLLLGQSLEGQEKITDAVAAYQKGADLASEQGESQLVIIGRMAIARLMNGGMMPMK